MHDEHDDRVFQAHRQPLGRDVARLARSVAYAFERLTARLYDAPWAAKTKRCGGSYTHI